MNKTTLLIGSIGAAGTVGGGGILMHSLTHKNSDKNKVPAEGPTNAQPKPSVPGPDPSPRVFQSQVTTNIRIAPATHTEQELNPALLDCKNCHVEDWQKLIYYFQTDQAHANDRAHEQYTLISQLSIQNSDLDIPANVPPPTTTNSYYDFGKSVYEQWMDKWKNKITTDGEDWQCVHDLNLDRIHKKFPRLLAAKTPNHPPTNCEHLKTEVVQWTTLEGGEDNDDETVISS